ncbi:chemotaxis protein [Campylobacter sp. MIT 99-7217]|uniref:protein phosphatase CheZ n=1 Tax=Campylobacter sp. MIT 99-7217 TaxID=535091 RepID=UPI00115BC875|nr:protein phosphatase CheZ [Campylobacter sp. MIT 99-7217]TQR33072.1 chemotaxis protein [Campylobacter sp. MIT 99-7217]
MTQEELDALMTTDSDMENLDKSLASDVANSAKSEENFQINPGVNWPPPPPNKEHKVVHQLDDVTRDSEEKATEMMDKLEIMNNYFGTSEALSREFERIVDRNIDIFSKLSERFPEVQTFKEALGNNSEAKTKLNEMQNNLQNGQDTIMMAMDAMQYQDIHRQKIERVINVMRALSRYMSSLFEGKIDDKNRVSSAVHIEGDSTTEVVSNDDIEALIASLGKK